MMQYYLLLSFFFLLSLYCVKTQPSDAPTPTVFLNLGDRYNQWVWFTTAQSQLLSGVTYTIGYNSSTSVGFLEQNVTFTVLSTCPQLPVRCSTCTAAPLNAPPNNQGWRILFTTSSTDSYDGMAIYDQPTTFGTTISGKTSWTFDMFDVNNCIEVNYLSFTTTDPPTNGHNADYWSGSVTKKRNATTTNAKKQCVLSWKKWVGNPYNTYYESVYSPCLTNGHTTVTCPGSEFCPYGGNANPGPVPYDKRTNSKRTTNYYVYWIDIEGQPGSSVPSVGSYGNGINYNGQVAHSQALATAYA